MAYEGTQKTNRRSYKLRLKRAEEPPWTMQDQHALELGCKVNGVPIDENRLEAVRTKIVLIEKEEAEAIAKKEGKNLIKVSEDANCFFESVAVIMKGLVEGWRYEASDIRREVMKLMANSVTEWEEKVSVPDNPTSYLKRMSRDTEYVTPLEVRYTAEWLQASITVRQARKYIYQKVGEVLWTPCLMVDLTTRSDIVRPGRYLEVMYYMGKRHYEPMVPQ